MVVDDVLVVIFDVFGFEELDVLVDFVLVDVGEWIVVLGLMG